MVITVNDNVMYSFKKLSFVCVRVRVGTYYGIYVKEDNFWVHPHSSPSFEAGFLSISLCCYCSFCCSHKSFRDCPVYASHLTKVLGLQNPLLWWGREGQHAAWGSNLGTQALSTELFPKTQQCYVF